MPSGRYYRFKTTSREEKIKKLKIFFFSLFFLSVILAMFWLILISPLFYIQNINFSDETTLNRDYILNMISDIAPLGLGKNLIILSKSRLKSELAAAFPAIADVTIKKKPFHTLVINFQNRVQIGIWCHPVSDEPRGNRCYYFDKDGIAFAPVPQTEGSLILKVEDLSKKDIVLGDKILDTDKISFITAFSDKIAENNKFKILEFKIKPNSSVDLEAVTDWGFSVYLDETQDPVIATANLFTVLNESIKNSTSNLAYIDLRTPNGRIFYCPVGQKCAED